MFRYAKFYLASVGTKILWKLDRWLCLHIIKVIAVNWLKGIRTCHPSGETSNPKILSYTRCLKIWPGEPGVPQTSKPCEALSNLKGYYTKSDNTEFFNKIRWSATLNNYVLSCIGNICRYDSLMGISDWEKRGGRSKSPGTLQTVRMKKGSGIKNVRELSCDIWFLY